MYKYKITYLDVNEEVISEMIINTDSEQEANEVAIIHCPATRIFEDYTINKID